MLTIAELGQVFHGTSARHLDTILKDGLRPRGKTSGVWKDNPSDASCVYLTTAYALHFASAAVGHDNTADGLIVEVNPALLLPWYLLSDEDAVAQVLVHQNHSITHGKTLKSVTKLVLKLQNEYSIAAEQSADLLGNFRYQSIIPMSAIRKITRVKKAVSDITWVGISDPTITIMNYRFMGTYYRAISRWIASGAVGDPHDYADSKDFADRFDCILKAPGMLERIRDMLEVVYDDK